jgi:hypothetical protein
MNKALIIAGIAATVAGCTLPPNNDYHGTVFGATTTTTPYVHVNASPVTITGRGEQVKTAALVATGYTVSYRASSNCLIAAPVQEDGSEGVSIIAECAAGDTPAVSGTTTFRASGRTTVHVSNTEAAWSITFTPLS